MSFHSIRGELRRLGTRTLFELVINQRESICLMNGPCPFYFKHKGYGFCLSEVLGRGCELQNLEKLEEETCQNDEMFNSPLPLAMFDGDTKTTP